MSGKHIFISYSHKNAAQVRKLRDELVARGESVWWDQDILAGQDWKLEIRKALKESHTVLLCFSKEVCKSSRSGLFPEALDAISEFRLFRPGEIFLIPLRLSECDIPMFEIDDTRSLDRLQRIDLFPMTAYANAINRLMAAVRRLPINS